MKNEFIPYEIALAMKELGFNEKCLACYDEGVFGLTVMSLKEYYTNSKEDTWNCAAPLYQQAFRWFREEHDLHPTIIRDGKVYCLYTEKFIMSRHLVEEYATYEEAELACLKKLIEIINQNKEDESNSRTTKTRFQGRFIIPS